jgi:hypothetical protein
MTVIGSEMILIRFTLLLEYGIRFDLEDGHYVMSTGVETSLNVSDYSKASSSKLGMTANRDAVYE